MRNFFLPFFLFFIVLLQYAEDAIAQVKTMEPFTFPAVAASDFIQQNYTVDTSAGAVFLIDAGQALFEPNNDGDFAVRQRTFKRIRLLNKNSLGDLATVQIKLIVSKYFKIKVENFRATTYNLKDGQIATEAVAFSSLFKEKDGVLQVLKFTFPSLKEGSIIEYSYDLVIPSCTIILPWQFQDKYPKLMSRYTVEIPSTYHFATVLNGLLIPVADTVKHYDLFYEGIYHEPISVTYDDGTKGNTIGHIWLYENVPALKEERYITTLNNYAQNIEFYELPGSALTSYMFPPGWPAAVRDLLADPGFAGELEEPDGWLNNDLRDAAGKETDTLGRAKSIYYYVRNNYICTDHSANFLSQYLKETAKFKRGNVVDINMLLIALLRRDGFKAYPVLLSTRDNGKAADDYPLVSRMNYVIVKTEIQGQTHFLDATVPELGFGLLDNNCYNGNARLINRPTSLIDFSADSLIEASVTNAFFTAENNVWSGNITTTLGNMESLALRKKMKKVNTEDYFNEKKKAINLDADISNMTLDSLHLPEEPATVKFDVTIKTGDDIIYLSPLLTEALAENPFAEAERIFPVEMPYCPDETYVLNMQIPEDYEVDELPESARITLNDDQGLFEYLIMSDGSHIQLRCRLKLNRANFLPEDYKTLREFYSFVVEKENEQIVFKKKK